MLIARIGELISSKSKTVYSPRDLYTLYDEIRSEWQIPKRLTLRKFIDLVSDRGPLQQIVLRSQYAKRPKRYVLDGFSHYELALSTQSNSYLSHGTAARLHGLTDRDPGTIYVNKEQSPKPHHGSLTQEALNRAFSRKQRESRYVLRHGKFKATLLNGKDTGDLGVQILKGQQGEKLKVTSVERTLIDITVRPAYAGGVLNVLHCYKTGKSLVSPQKLISMLQDLEFIYPYHQAMGYYMEKAGFQQDSYRELKIQQKPFQFFLAHAIDDRIFNSEWKVFVPAILESTDLTR
jgi:hypothetical protein